MSAPMHALHVRRLSMDYRGGAEPFAGMTLYCLFEERWYIESIEAER
jgi:hypothetical protein